MCSLSLQGLRSVGPHVVEKLCEVVKLRNKLAKANGFEDFYGARLYALHTLEALAMCVGTHA